MLRSKNFSLQSILVMLICLTILTLIPIFAQAQYAVTTSFYNITASNTTTGFVVSSTGDYIFGVVVSGSTSNGTLLVCNATTYTDATANKSKNLLMPPIAITPTTIASTVTVSTSSTSFIVTSASSSNVFGQTGLVYPIKVRANKGIVLVLDVGTALVGTNITVIKPPPY